MIETRLQEIGTKFVLTDQLRAPRMVEVASRLDLMRDVFVTGDKAVHGCKPFQQLLLDSEDGNVFLRHFLDNVLIPIQIPKNVLRTWTTSTWILWLGWRTRVAQLDCQKGLS